MKSQSNPEIAGSPRNHFRVGLMCKIKGGRALNGRGGYILPTPIKLRIPCISHGSETVRDKLHRQKGNSPDHQLRSLNNVQWKRMLFYLDNQDVGLEAAIHLKSA